MLFIFEYHGTVTVVPHILYIPIILFAYRYPKRGVFFASAIAVIYLVAFNFIVSTDSELLIDAVGRTCIFIIVGILVSSISKQIQKQKREYISLFNNLSDGIFFVSNDEHGKPGKISECNKKAIELTGYVEEELTGQDFTSLIAEEDREKFLFGWKDCDSSSVLFPEISLKQKGGLKMPFSFTVYKSPAGTGNEKIVIIQSSEKRIKAEKDAVESRLKLDVFLKIAGLGYWERKSENSRHFWSDETFSIFNISPSPDMTIDENDYLNLIHPEFREDFVCEFQRSISEKKEFSYKYRIITGNGEERWIHSRCRHYADENGIIVRSLGTHHDITADTQAQMKAFEQAKFFETLIETIPLPVFHKDKNGIYLGCNQAFANLSGKSKNFILGKTVFDVFDKKYAVEQSKMDNLVLSLPGIQISQGEILDVYKNPRSIITSKAAVKDKEGDKGIIIGVMQDITEIKKTKENLKKSLEEKNVLLQEVHHRVKNNLASITGILEIEKSRIKDKDALRFLDEAENRIQSMVIVHESLYHSDNVGEIDAYMHFRNLFESVLISYSQNTFITSEISTSGCKIDINSAIPCSLVVNEILTNAMKYAFLGRAEGKITIEMQCDEDEYNLIISDDGCGIPENISPEKSPTLGMKVIYNIVRLQLMGTISLERERGTKWILIWPKKPI